MSDTAKDIADSLLSKLKAKSIDKIGIDEVRSAIVQYNISMTDHGDLPLSQYEMDGMETMVLRKIIEGSMS